MTTEPLTCTNALIELASSPESEEVWMDIEKNAHSLANTLRSKSPNDYHTQIGQSGLPVTLAELLKRSCEAKSPSEPARAVAFELLRVVANLLMDHDVNRQLVLDAGIPQIILRLVERHTARSSFNQNELKVAKIAVGSLLNLSIGYDPARKALNSFQASPILLRLLQAVHQPGQWASFVPESNPEEAEAEYRLRFDIADWSWRTISEISESVSPSIGVESLDALVGILTAFSPPLEGKSPLVLDEKSRQLFSEIDLECLEGSTTLLEALCLDCGTVRLAFANTVHAPNSQSLLHRVVRFIEFGDYPDHWKLDGTIERAKREKRFDLCKGAAIKALVCISGEDEATDILWDNQGTLVMKMIEWVQTSIKEPENRDDHLICASLALGNIARKDSYCVALLKPETGLLQALLETLKPTTDVKIMHGVLGLLKNLAQAPSNRAIFGEMALLEKLTESLIWGERLDMAETVQVSAIGIAKYLCNGNFDNSLSLVGKKERGGVDQILALISRSDSIVVKSEGTRVLAYCIKSLWRKNPEKNTDIDQDRRAAMNKMVQPPYVRALVDLLVRSQKHIILLNESIFSLTLLSGQSVAAPIVMQMLQAPITIETSNPTGAISTTPASPASGVKTLKDIIENQENKFPLELRLNACSLISTISKNAPESSKVLPDQQGSQPFKDYFADVLKAAALESEKLKQATQWTLDSSP